MTLHDDRVPQNEPASEDAPASMSEQEQKDYADYVAHMAEKANGKLFLNHDEQHAEIVIAQLFKSAVREIKILTGCLKDDVYGSDRVRNAAISFACDHPHGVMRVLSERPIGHSRLLDAVRPILPDGNVVVIEGDSGMEGSVHFTVVDDLHFRFEEDVSKCEAMVAFGRQEFGQRLSSLFDTMVRLSDPRKAESSSNGLGTS